MKLLENIGAPDDLSDIDSFPWLWAFLNACDPKRHEFIDAKIIGLALALADKQQFGVADAGVIEISHRLDLTLDRYLQICLKLNEVYPEFRSTRLFAHYLSRGGAHPKAFEYEIYRLFVLKQYEEVVSLFQKSKNWFDWTAYHRSVLFLIANAFSKTENQDENFTILKYLVETYPEDKDYQRNMSYLALAFRHDAAGKYIRKISQAIAESFVDDYAPDAAVNGVVVDARQQGAVAIVNTLKRYACVT